MKKEWLFFCVFFSVSLSPASLHALLIACYGFPVVNNNIGIPANSYPNQLIVAGADNSEFLLAQRIAQQNNKTLFQQRGCCISNAYIKNSVRNGVDAGG